MCGSRQKPSTLETARHTWQHRRGFAVCRRQCVHATCLLQAIDWARSHDDEAKRIAQNALAFAMRNLSRQVSGPLKDKEKKERKKE